MSISCVTISFILEVCKDACSPNLGIFVSLLFNGTVFDFRRTVLKCFEFVFVKLMYAAAPDTLLEASANTSNSTFVFQLI